MAITPVGVGPHTISTTEATLTPALPVGVQEGDFLLVSAVHRVGGNIATYGAWADGYTQIARLFSNVGTSDLTVAAAFKFAGPAEVAATHDAGTFSGQGQGMFVAAFRAVDPADWDDATALTGESLGDPGGNTPATWTPGDIVTATPGACVVSMVGTTDDNALGLLAGSARSFTLLAGGGDYDTTDGGDHAMGMAYRVVDTPGTVPICTWEQTAPSSDFWAHITIALKPLADPEPEPEPMAGNRIGGTGAIRRSPARR